MKNKWLSILAFILVFIGVILYIDATPNADTIRRNLVVDLSNELLRSGNEKTKIAFDELFVFPWSKVYFFGPYTSPSRINFTLKTIWVRSPFLAIQYSEGITLIVFKNGIRVVEFIEFPRSEGDFSNLEIYRAGFSRDDAIFILEENKYIVWANAAR